MLHRAFARLPLFAAAAAVSFVFPRRFICSRDNLRNIAVIAHVDHGKTTLVDAMLQQSGTMVSARNRVMDSKDQEKERGITILAKNTAIQLEDGKKVNIVDTPGHLDFSGEVERALQMVEGFILLVDAAEGVKPGTRYVLHKALSLNLKPIVVINKIDKDDSHVDRTVSQISDLFLETAVSDDQLDIFFLYGSGREGWMNTSLNEKGGTLAPLFSSIFNVIPRPSQPNEDDPLQFLVAQLDENQEKNYQIAIGRIFKGKVALEDVVTVLLGDQRQTAKVKEIFAFRGIEKVPVTEASYGDIVSLSLVPPQGKTIPLKIGASLCLPGFDAPLPYKPPDEPTFSLVLQESQASWKGKEVQRRGLGSIEELRERLRKEALVNCALKVENEDVGVRLLGRGPLHLSVLMEDMRREGYEFEVRAPTVVTKEVDGVKCEPWERLQLELSESKMSDIASLLSLKFAEIVEITQLGDQRVHMEAIVPVRLLTDFPMRFNTITAGGGVMHNSLDGFRPMAAASNERGTGALISVENGEATDYSMSHMAAQGTFFVEPGEEVRYGQIIGENGKTYGQYLGVNICKRNEQLGGMRANSFDKAKKTKLGSFLSRPMRFEDCMSWVTDEELITVTPMSIRMRLPGFNGKTVMRTKKKN